MRTVEHPWETWRAIIDFLRATGLGYAREHADELERALDETPAGVDPVRLGMSDDTYLRSYTFARWRLGIPLDG
jgi:hypothetical protein